MASMVFTLLSFVIALIISTVIIYVITKVFGETEGITTAFLAALIGTAVYTIIYYVDRPGPDRCIHSGNCLAAGVAETVHHRLAQIPVDCGCCLDCDVHCRMVPASPDRSAMK